eukprot:gene12775-17321_t
MLRPDVLLLARVELAGYDPRVVTANGHDAAHARAFAAQFRWLAEHPNMTYAFGWVRDWIWLRVTPGVCPAADGLRPCAHEQVLRKLCSHALNPRTCRGDAAHRALIGDAAPHARAPASAEGGIVGEAAAGGTGAASPEWRAACPRRDPGRAAAGGSDRPAAHAFWALGSVGGWAMRSHDEWAAARGVFDRTCAVAAQRIE